MRLRKFSALMLALILVLVPFSQVSAEGIVVEASVVEVSKYGNVTLDIAPAALYEAGFELGDILSVEVNEQTLSMPFVTLYPDVDTASLGILDYKEEGLHTIIAINMGNFSETYDADIGTTIKIGLAEKAGYADEFLLRKLERTNDIADYNNDPVVFANFREIDTTGIKAGILYRSSSPINNEIKRAAYADDLMKAHNIKTVMNMADTADNIESYVAQDDFNSPYYLSLYEAGQVITLDMTVDVAGDDFSAKLANGLRFLAENEGPYLVHCNEGKDRAGFCSAILSALMGASLDEVVEDYMVTYENYYHVEKDSDQYDKIAESNIIASITTIVSQQQKGTDISNRNLAEDTKNYLLRIGMTEAEINKLISRLTDQVGDVYIAPLLDDGQLISDGHALIENVPVGTAYQAEALDLEGYELVGHDTNSAAESGYVKPGIQTVNYIYKTVLAVEDPGAGGNEEEPIENEEIQDEVLVTEKELEDVIGEETLIVNEQETSKDEVSSGPTSVTTEEDVKRSQTKAPQTSDPISGFYIMLALSSIALVAVRKKTSKKS